ncbi:hypothetical protein Misp05_45480 [Micromonospora sp. NBRC 107095]|nr:hypothetical protein Misp05_45480 [Micromonospora sp. NBRC 107095]
MPRLATTPGAGEPEPVQQAQGGQFTEADLTGPSGEEQHAVNLIGGEDLVVIEQMEKPTVTAGDVGIDGQEGDRS